MKTYNRFQDPNEPLPEIKRLRKLHAAMDRAVRDAYGRPDLTATCEFLLDYEKDDDEDESGGGRRRKRPWRYRWPDDVRDEVLARLLELNRKRAEEERVSGAASDSTRTTRRKKTARRAVPRPIPCGMNRAFLVSTDPIFRVNPRRCDERPRYQQRRREPRTGF